MEKQTDKPKIKDSFMMHFAVCPKCNSNIIINEAIQKAKQSQKGMIKIEDVEKMIDDNKLLELLSELEHQQWEDWSKNIVNNEKISEDRLDKWAHLWKPYNRLSQEQKDKDRVYARKVLLLVKQSLKELGEKNGK